MSAYAEVELYLGRDRYLRLRREHGGPRVELTLLKKVRPKRRKGQPIRTEMRVVAKDERGTHDLRCARHQLAVLLAFENLGG